jgi:hypothetical protein
MREKPPIGEWKHLSDDELPESMGGNEKGQRVIIQELWNVVGNVKLVTPALLSTRVASVPLRSRHESYAASFASTDFSFSQASFPLPSFSSSWLARLQREAM